MWYLSKNVFLFIPNLIGYVRLVLMIGSVFVRHNSIAFFSCCVSNVILDLFDGMIARRFNQCSNFGAFLDMVTDRLTTMTLYFVLSGLYPERTEGYIMFAVLDIFSHWLSMHFHAINTVISGNSSHKVQESSFWLLNLYYKSDLLMIPLIVLHEGFLVSSYLVKHHEWLLDNQYFTCLFYHISLPSFLLKNFISVLQIVYVLQCFKTLDKPKNN